MRKTKIVCTLGPASSDKNTLRQLVKAGIDVARLNFSHGNYDENKERIKYIKELEDELNQSIGIMLDTKGPEIRTGELKEEEIELITGEEIILTTRKFKGDRSRISVTYQDICQDLSVGSIILLDDGLIELEVVAIEDNEMRCKIINGGKLGSRKGVNIPGEKVNLPGLTQKDREDIKFGIQQGVHFIAASFVRRAADVIEIRKLLEEEKERGNGIKIIAKIENQQGVNNIEEIIEVADGIMIARGDLGVEIPPEKVPAIQKMIINRCNKAAKPVITATQMLESMIRNPRPTRAEASDVANAIFDGTDATMLSGESAIGSYPVKAVETMARIAKEVEKSPSYKNSLKSKGDTLQTVTEAISFASCETATDLDAAAIITATGSGYTARMVSRYRSLTPIIAVTPDEVVQHTLTLSWGIYPLLVSHSNSTDEMIDNAITAALEYDLVDEGDLVTVTAGVPVGIPGTTNLIKVDVVGKPLIEGQGVGKGIVTGKVRLAQTAKEASQKVKDGNILICHMTDEDYNPTLEKAGAIVTAEDGLTSHAALTGLKLGIPVIVNAGPVFELLHEGELVTVDGVRGLIYRGNVHIK